MFAAAIVRGYSGFGFSALVVTSLSLIMAPARIVPVLLALEVVASLRLLPSSWRHVDWHSLRWLLLGCAISIPVGVHVLATVPSGIMRILIALAVLVASVLIWRGFRLRGGISGRVSFATGLASGAMNGAAAIGGLAVVVVFLAAAVEMAAVRATLIALFFSTDLYTLALAAYYGLVGGAVLLQAGLLLLPLFAGIGVGKYCFERTDQRSFRCWVLLLLIGLSLASLLRALFSGYGLA